MVKKQYTCLHYKEDGQCDYTEGGLSTERLIYGRIDYCAFQTTPLELRPLQTNNPFDPFNNNEFQDCLLNLSSHLLHRYTYPPSQWCLHIKALIVYWAVLKENEAVKESLWKIFSLWFSQKGRVLELWVRRFLVHPSVAFRASITHNLNDAVHL